LRSAGPNAIAWRSDDAGTATSSAAEPGAIATGARPRAVRAASVTIDQAIAGDTWDVSVINPAVSNGHALP
jgi:hypothetical protein